MLVQLNISNFAIIDKLEVLFRPGLNIISGETGAGKSIIINAVNLLLGGRASSDLIRTGSKEARVEALFQIQEIPELKILLERLDIPHSNDELLIKRVISKEGRGRSTINGSMVNLQLLSRIGSMLINISGQHEHQMLLRPENHIYILDEFGEIEEQRRRFSEIYNEYNELKKSIMEHEERLKKLKDEQDFIRFKLREIDSANLRDGEDVQLEEERRRLKYAKTLMDIISIAYNEIYENENSILSRIGFCIRELERGADIEKRISPLLNGLESLKIELQERALELRDMLHTIDINPQRLQEVEDRIYEINTLKKKYGGTIEEIKRYRDTLKSSIDGLEGEEELIRKQRERLKHLEKVMLGEAISLSRKRKEVAKKLEEMIERELSILDMKRTTFKVSFGDEISDPSPNVLNEDGFDMVEFLISPNPGEELRPLSKIASGGELSRILLALKTIMGRGSSIETLVFDEVDSGIGGATAEVVGDKLRALSEYHQILCITHLPQIASKGTSHFLVTKKSDGKRTTTAISELSHEERVKEIARMLGGRVITKKAIEHAKEMLN